MTPLSGIQTNVQQSSLLTPVGQAPSELQQPAASSPELKEAFQKFVAGTFYKQMFKALRSAQGKPAYFHGGQAEEMFQSQLDQQISDDLASRDGNGFSENLFSAFSRQLNAQSAASIESAGSATL